jgi:uracil-DNA glycosylase
MAAALRDELAELTSSVRAFLEWHAATGSTGLPGTWDALDDATGARPAAGAPAPRAATAWPQAGQLSPPAPRSFEPPRAAPSAPRNLAAVSQPSEGAARSGAPAPRIEAAPGNDAAPRRDPLPRSEARADTIEERSARLSLLAEEVRSCQKCALHEGRKQTVFSRGSPLSEIVFVGEGPGADEDQQGEPFVGAAGQLLDRMIAAMGYGRDEVYICNIVKCRPPKNRKPEPVEMASCSPYLVSQLSVIKPRVIVALGATAVQGLIGTTEGITKLRGTWKAYKGSIPMMPTFHPAYLLRQPSAKREVWSDLKEVMRYLGKSVSEKG